MCEHRGHRRTSDVLPYIILPLFILLRQSLALGLELDWWPESPSGLPLCDVHSDGVGTRPHLAFYVMQRI